MLYINIYTYIYTILISHISLNINILSSYYLIVLGTLKRQIATLTEENQHLRSQHHGGVGETAALRRSEDLRDALQVLVDAYVEKTNEYHSKHESNQELIKLLQDTNGMLIPQSAATAQAQAAGQLVPHSTDPHSIGGQPTETLESFLSAQCRALEKALLESAKLKSSSSAGVSGVSSSSTTPLQALVESQNQRDIEVLNEQKKQNLSSTVSCAPSETTSIILGPASGPASTRNGRARLLRSRVLKALQGVLGQLVLSQAKGGPASEDKSQKRKDRRQRESSNTPARRARQVMWDLEDEESVLLNRMKTVRVTLSHANGLLNCLKAMKPRDGHAPIDLSRLDLRLMCLQAQGDFEELQHAVAVLVHSRSLLVIHTRPKTKRPDGRTPKGNKGKVRFAYPLEEVQLIEHVNSIAKKIPLDEEDEAELKRQEKHEEEERQERERERDSDRGEDRDRDREYEHDDHRDDDLEEASSSAEVSSRSRDAQEAAEEFEREHEHEEQSSPHTPRAHDRGYDSSQLHGGVLSPIQEESSLLDSSYPPTRDHEEDDDLARLEDLEDDMIISGEDVDNPSDLSDINFDQVYESFEESDRSRYDEHPHEITTPRDRGEHAHDDLGDLGYIDDENEPFRDEISELSTEGLETDMRAEETLGHDQDYLDIVA